MFPFPYFLCFFTPRTELSICYRHSRVARTKAQAARSQETISHRIPLDIRTNSMEQTLS